MVILYRIVDQIESALWALKVFLLTWRDIARLLRIYPRGWGDGRFRQGMGYALLKASDKVGDSIIREAGEALVSGEFQSEAE